MREAERSRTQLSGEASANLERFLKPAGTYDLVRLGRNHDGGYLVDRRDVLASTALISLGINDDWSFENDFLTMNPVPLDAYDGSVSPRIYARRIAKFALAGDRRQLTSSVNALRTYRRFFQKDRRHHPLMVGFAGAEGSTTLREIFDDRSETSVFLKIDIEGWEYRLLDDLVKYVDRLSSLAIEFHDYDLHVPRVRDFIAATNLRVAHVHANNWSPISDMRTPLALEVTLSSSNPVSPEPAPLPHPLDQPNNATRPEISIHFD
ncbi:hypothetical protein SMNI109538_18995 [Smaragdicoccus niigatensis]